MVNLSQVVFTTLVATINLVQALMLNGSSVTKVNVITTTTGTITKTSEVVVPAEPTPTSPAVVSTPIAVGLPPVITGLSQIAKFEDDFSIPRTGVAIDTYLDLYWQGMSLARTDFSDDDTQWHAGLIPNSPSNYASFSSKNDVTLQQGTPQMTTVYLDSTVTSFNLREFFYGCAAEREMGFVPVTCEITITGFNTTDDQVAEQTFDFKADGRLQQMTKAVAEGFSGVKTVAFAIGPDDNDATAFIDTVSYEVF